MKIQKVIRDNILHYTVTHDESTTIKAYQDDKELSIVDNVFEVSIGDPYIIKIQELINDVIKDNYIEYINMYNEKETECTNEKYNYPLMGFEGPETYVIGNGSSGDYNQGFLEGIIVGGIATRGI